MRHAAAMDDIEIVPSDSEWPRLFLEERRRLETALAGEDVQAIEHFGSTAVPGLPAKPIIDILIGTGSLEAARRLWPTRLDALGYAFWADNPKADRLFFVKGLLPHGERRTHHVHVGAPGGDLWRQLAFRDFLAAHPEEAARYAALKQALAETHRLDREAYTNAKSDYISAIMQRIANTKG
jgi:GrpB-like predicted nucleotidyltransferase (UPF0157 family)